VTDRDVASAVDALRAFIAKADAFASVTEEVFDSVIWTVDGENIRRLEHLSQMVAATREAARAAARAGDKLAIELSTHRTGA
jgi:hypothetical protein